MYLTLSTLIGFSLDAKYLASFSFLHNTAYGELEPLNLRPQANVTLTFATEQQNAILLYTGDKQHLAAELFRERIRSSYDVGMYHVRKVVNVRYFYVNCIVNIVIFYQNV